MARKATPNRALSAAMADADMSNTGLARRVRDLAHAHGVPNSTDHVAVGRWLDGTQPVAKTARLIAAVMSKRLRRTITPAALGFTGSIESQSPDAPAARKEVKYPHDAEEATGTLSAVAGADLDDSPTAGLRTWDAYATPGVITGYLFGAGQDASTTSGDAPPLDATAIRLTTARLMELDFQVGGGHTRELLLYYFRNQVLPLFDALPRAARRRDLFLATAELAQMLGWSAYDAGRHGAAQRYFVHALRLAREAGDHLLGARLLSNLSHQANYLGHFQDAVHLARAAQSAASRSSSATTVSMLFSMEARALASLGDFRGCTSALTRAEETFERGDPSVDPEWISYFNQAELAGENAHCFRDLRRPEETRRFAELALAPTDTPVRTRAFITMVTAMGALHAGSLDEAVSTARQAVALAGSLQSSRYRRYVSDFVRAATTLHPRDSRVIDLTVFTASVIQPSNQVNA